MFIYNFKLNKSKLTKTFIFIALIIIFLIISFSIYIIFFKSQFVNDNSYGTNQIIELNETNYTTFLKSANENIDSFVGVKFRITGYIYRHSDFNQNEFVIARNMRLGKNAQYVVVGFLCNYSKASSFEDDTWVQGTGKIKKGRFNNSDIAILDIISIEQANSLENVFVNPPN